ncbi:MAG: TrbC family F-type conjugative pilus assembly protein [Thermofilaceae archaeon]
MFLEVAQVYDIDTYRRAPEIYQRGLEEVQRRGIQEQYRRESERIKQDVRYKQNMEEAQRKLEDIKRQAKEFQRNYAIEEQGGGFKIVPRDKPFDIRTGRASARKPAYDFQGMAYLFVSSSMGENLLRSYAKQIEAMGLTDKVVMVMRGCIGGCRKIKPTLEFISRVLEVREGKEGIRAQFWIDPLLFRMYNIDRVPCLVIDNREPRVSVDERNFRVVVERVQARKVCGDWSLDYLLEEYFRRR